MVKSDKITGLKSITEIKIASYRIKALLMNLSVFKIRFKMSKFQKV